MKTTEINIKANKTLQAGLHKRIAESDIYQVAKETAVGVDSLRSYLADLPMRVSTFRGIEAILGTLLATAAGGHAPEARTATASRR